MPQGDTRISVSESPIEGAGSPISVNIQGLKSTGTCQYIKMNKNVMHLIFSNYSAWWTSMNFLRQHRTYFIILLWFIYQVTKSTASFQQGQELKNIPHCQDYGTSCTLLKVCYLENLIVLQVSVVYLGHYIESLTSPSKKKIDMQNPRLQSKFKN